MNPSSSAYCTSGGYEYHGYNMDHQESQERFQDSVKIIQGLWTTPDFSYESRYNHLDHINLVPPPVQKPHPPIYIAATRTLTTMEFLVSSGHNLCIAVVQDTADAIDLCQRFVKMSKEAGTGRTMADIPFFRYFYVADTEEQVKQDTANRLDWVADIMQWRRFIERGSEVYQHMDDWRRQRTQVPQGHEHLSQNRAIVGTPDQCVAQIKELQKAGIGHFGCNFDFGGMDHHKVLKSMELFSKEVMPRLG